MMRYVSLEVDMDTGGRGPRGEVLQRLLCLATGAEACMVVNNNAAAVYLLVNTFSPPGRVIVSRGELVEIGGSFRLPEILRHAAAEVVEVGTTNRTYAEDYRKAARRDDLILKVHKSNYAIEGFAHEASVDELAAVAADTGSRLAYDLGSGALFDFRGVGLGEDPTVSDEVALGVDCVTMSGDKLLGGPQAGILAGRAELVARLKRNPLRRALRVDKVTIAALQHVLRQYLFAAEPAAELPSLGRILGDVERLRERALRIADGLGAGARVVSVVDDEGAVGGGSLTRIALPSVAVVVACADERDAVDTARRMRSHDPPLFPRVRGREVRINMIAIAPDEDTDVRRVLDATLVVRES
jgi:L-seryl-tRNA(Ser) seleniumtransferase